MIVSSISSSSVGPAELAQRRLGDGKVAALDRPVKGRSRMALRCDAVPAFLGPDSAATLPLAVCRLG
jgi:hypothetical protein